jgi:hypothetical protein
MDHSTTKGNGLLFVPLDASYYEDDKILCVSEMAELLYIRSLCFAKRMLTDGKLTRRQVLRILPDPKESLGDPRDVKDDPGIIKELLDAHLWQKMGDQYVIAAWAKWHESASSVHARSESANHQRWHVSRGIVSDRCPLCLGNPTGTPSDIHMDSLGDPIEETETEQSRAETDLFDQFWEIYPNKREKPKARQAWKRALGRAHAADICAGAMAYRDDPNREDEFTKHPTTWLNAEAWRDPPLPARNGKARRTSSDNISAFFGSKPALEASNER